MNEIGKTSVKSLTMANANINNMILFVFRLTPSRLKRDSTKLNSADMMALLSFLEANQRNRHDNANDELNSLEYQKPFYGPYGNFDGANNNDDDAAAINGGEWWNEWIEPSVQLHGNSRNHFEENARKRLTTPGNNHSILFRFIYCLFLEHKV